MRALAAELEQDAGPEAHDDLLGLPELRRLFGIGRDALLAAIDRGEIEAHRGTRQRLLVRRSEAERWIASRPAQPRQARQTRAPLVEDPEPITSWQERAEQRRREIGGTR